MSQLNAHLDVLHGLVQFANTLLSSPEHVQLRTSQHTEQVLLTAFMQLHKMNDSKFKRRFNSLNITIEVY